MKNRILIFVLVFLIGISFVSAGYTRSVVVTSDFSSVSLNSFVENSLAFDKSMCQEGTDFILQIVPYSCEPLVVRSDLLEENDVVVTCQIAATKINPLVDVDAIETMTITLSGFSKGIKAISYLRSQSALGLIPSGSLSGNLLENLGYVVIVLEKNANESSMPDYIEGNLTAKIRYDVKEAWGVGDAEFLLPEMSDSEWKDRYIQYGFWYGKGYLRATGITDNEATISVYSDANIPVLSGGEKRLEYARYNLELGKESNEIYLPGFNPCMAGLTLRLDDIEDPDTRVRLKINDEIVEVTENENFLENKCRVVDIQSRGLYQGIRINCKDDKNSGTFELSISPKIKLEINGEKKDYEAGDKLFIDENGKSVYLGYVGSTSDVDLSDPDLINSVYIAVVAIPGETSDRLSAEELRSIATYMKFRKKESNKGATFIDTVNEGFSKTSSLTIMGFKKIISNQDIRVIPKRSGSADYIGEFKGKEVQIIDFTDASDYVSLISLNQGYKQPYDNAINDFRTVIGSYPDEKENNFSEDTLGERSLYESIKLSNKLRMNQKTVELCDEFSDKYPLSIYNAELRDICGNSYFSSSSGIIEYSVLINGDIKKISFQRIIEPSFEDYGAEVLVENSAGDSMIFKLEKGEVRYLSELTGEVLEKMYYSDDTSTRVYYKFSNNQWYWSLDNQNWKDTSVSLGVSAFNQGVISELDAVKNSLSAGENILISKGIKEQPLTDQEYISLESLSPDSARIAIHTIQNFYGRVFNTDTKTLQLDKELAIAGGYSFTLKEINLEKLAKVSVHPIINNQYSKSTFPFRIGIEKRDFKLSDEQISDRINSLNSSIESLEKTVNYLKGVVEIGNKVCAATGAVLTVKNFINNLNGKSIARTSIMQGSGGWNERCKTEVANELFKSIDECYLSYAGEIDQEVENYANVLNKQESVLATIRENSMYEYRGKKVLDKEKYIELYSQYVHTGKLGSSTPSNTLQAALINSGAFDDGKLYQGVDASGKRVGEGIDLNNVNSLLNFYYLDKGVYSEDQLEQIDVYKNILLNKEISSEEKEIATKRLYTLLYQVSVNGEKAQEIKKTANKYNVNPEDVIYLQDKDSQVQPYRDNTCKEVSNIAYCNNNPNVPIAIVMYDSKEYVIILSNMGANKLIKEAVYDENGNSITGNEIPKLIQQIPYFEVYDEAAYKNKYINPEIRFFDSNINNGYPALVPIDDEEGWYAAPTAYDDSGVVNTYWLCNVGKNGLEQYMAPDDICELIKRGSTPPVFYGLKDSAKVKALMSSAENAISKAQRAKKNSRGEVCIDFKCYDLGAPETGISSTQCQDLMSPKDCSLLFNVCDPFICPSSRCDLGGRYHVKDVVQSGIIGSIALCYPNAKWKGGDVYVPVCVSGVYAGLDGWLQIKKSYRECLQEQLNSGQVVGICDELQSVYMCNFFWGQVAPVLKIGLTRIIGGIMGKSGKGGGEYSSIGNALSTAKDSLNYFKQYYAAETYRAFKLRSVGEISTGDVCNTFTSVIFPDAADMIDSLSRARSPFQFTAKFDEIPLTTRTNPALSHYKIYYQIYAGQDSGAFYQIYLKGNSDSSYYLDTGFDRIVASGYIGIGESEVQTLDKQYPSGYTQLCVSVNGQQQCGFKQVSTSFALNYYTEWYISQQASQTDITTEEACVEGTSSIYSALLNPNAQAAATEYTNPEISDRGLIRICATKDPGSQSDPYAGTQDARWVKVGYCDDKNIGCWLDTDSVKDIIKATNLQEGVLGETSKDYLQELFESGGYLSDTVFKERLKEAQDTSKTDEERIGILNEIINKLFWNSQKALVYFTRGKIYADSIIVLPCPDFCGSDGNIYSGYSSDTDTSTCEITFIKKKCPNGCEETSDGVVQCKIVISTPGGTEILVVPGSVYYFPNNLGETLYYTFSNGQWYWSQSYSQPNWKSTSFNSGEGIVSSSNMQIIYQLSQINTEPAGVTYLTSNGATPVPTTGTGVSTITTNIYSYYTSPILRFDDGSWIQTDFCYKYFEETWHWIKCNDINNINNIAWNKVSEGTPSLYPTVQFIKTLIKKNYLEGLNLLIERTKKDEEKQNPSLVAYEGLSEMDENGIFRFDLGKKTTIPRYVYFKYEMGWEWSVDKSNWMPSNTYTIIGGGWGGYKPQTGSQLRNLIGMLNGKNLEEGAAIIFDITLTSLFPEQVDVYESSDTCEDCFILLQSATGCTETLCKAIGNRLGKECIFDASKSDETRCSSSGTSTSSGTTTGTGTGSGTGTGAGTTQLSTANQKVLDVVEDLNGVSRSVVTDCDKSGSINCWDSVQYVYNKAGVTFHCVYSDKTDKRYYYNNELISIGVLRNNYGNIIFQNNENSCDNVGFSEKDKLDLLQPGDILSIVFDEDSPHNVIFIEWVDSNNKGEAKVFDWAAFTGHKVFEYSNINLKDNQHSVYMVWEPR
jgi:hypothetical protein